MALSDTLKLIITADGSQASSQFKKVGADAEKSLSGAQGGSSKLQAAMGLLGPAAIAAGAAAVAFGKASVDTYKNVGTEVLKLQRYTGGTAEETSRLRFAMQQAGIDVDGAAKAFGIFSKNIANTPQVFQQYGIATQDASGKTLSFHDILLNTAADFQRMPNGAEKTAEALKLFGRAGADMIPFLNRGADGIAELEKQTDKYGMTLSGKNLSDIKASKEAQRELTAAVQGLQVQLGEKLLPTVTSVTKAFTGMVKAIAPTIDWIDSATKSTGGFIGTLSSISPYASTFIKGNQIKDQFDQIRQGGKGASMSLDDFAAAMKISKPAAQDFLDTQKLSGTTFKTTEEAQKAYTQAVYDGKIVTEDATAKTVTYAESMKALNDAERALFDPQFALMDATQKLTELQQSGTASSEELAKAALDVDMAVRTLKAGMDDGSVSIDKTRYTLNGWVQAGYVTSAQALDIANKLGLVSAQANALDGKVVNIGMVLTFAASTADLQTIVNQGGGHQARAYGGAVHRGETYIVGDRRGMDTAETFTPNADGYITPSGNGGSSSPTNVNVFVGGQQVEAVVTSRQRYDARGRR